MTKTPWRAVFLVIICKRNRQTSRFKSKQLIIFPLIIASDFGCITRGRLHFYGTKRRITAATPVRSKITYHQYVGFCFGRVFSCSSSVLSHKNNIAIKRAIDCGRDWLRSNRYSVTLFLTTYQFPKITYHQYVGFWSLDVFPCHSSHWCHKNISFQNSRRITSSKPLVQQFMYHQYIRVFVFDLLTS